MKTWSKELITKTRIELEEMLYYTGDSGKLHWLIGDSDLEKGARFKNIDGNRFGIMTGPRAHPLKYIISLKDTKEHEIFETVDTLIEAGWVLD